MFLKAEEKLDSNLLSYQQRDECASVANFFLPLNIQFSTGLLFNDIYSASKFAVEGFCESLALQALKFDIK